jgi:hypothetical protein
MTRWERTRYARRCGRCGHEIPIGAPVFVLVIGKVAKDRCADCEGPAPPDLPAVIERVERPTPLPFARFTVDAIGMDWKAKSAGEDDDA